MTCIEKCSAIYIFFYTVNVFHYFSVHSHYYKFRNKDLIQLNIFFVSFAVFCYLLDTAIVIYFNSNRRIFKKIDKHLITFPYFISMTKKLMKRCLGVKQIYSVNFKRLLMQLKKYLTSFSQFSC